eukprot:5625401-Prymnesium_polylepis.1
MTVSGGIEEGGTAITARRVDVGSVLQQDLELVCVTLQCSLHKGRRPHVLLGASRGGALHLGTRCCTLEQRDDLIVFAEQSPGRLETA